MFLMLNIMKKKQISLLKQEKSVLYNCYKYGGRGTDIKLGGNKDFIYDGKKESEE